MESPPNKGGRARTRGPSSWVSHTCSRDPPTPTPKPQAEHDFSTRFLDQGFFRSASSPQPLAGSYGGWSAPCRTAHARRRGVCQKAVMGRTGGKFSASCVPGTYLEAHPCRGPCPGGSRGYHQRQHHSRAALATVHSDPLL